MKKIKWAYGITTVLSRLDDQADPMESTFRKTLKSLQAAGFDEPRIFVDGVSNGRNYRWTGLEITTRYPTIKAYGNWLLAVWELYIRNPTADRFALFQDDFVTYKNLRQYLEQHKYQENTYWNLYTFPPPNQAEPPENHTGWFEANQWGRGAVGLVFDLKTVTDLLKQNFVVEKPQHAGRRSKESIDGAVITALKALQYKEWVHSPSLIQHTGRISTLRHTVQKEALTFLGEEFDAMDLTMRENYVRV